MYSSVPCFSLLNSILSVKTFFRFLQLSNLYWQNTTLYIDISITEIEKILLKDTRQTFLIYVTLSLTFPRDTENILQFKVFFWMNIQ